MQNSEHAIAAALLAFLDAHGACSCALCDAGRRALEGEVPGCARCAAPVKPAEARLSVRALGEVLCHRCRTPQGGEEEPEGELEAAPALGFGLWQVSDRQGRFVAGGFTRHAAEANARAVLARGI
jgi:hypothetical protein